MFRPEPNSKYVDRAARDRAAQLLRDFISGRITNDHFDSEMPVTSDPAIWAIWDTLWLFYDDMSEHRLVGKHRMHPDTKRAAIRWLLFLDSDLSYKWPKFAHAGNDPTSGKGENLSAKLRRQLGFPKSAWEIRADDFDSTGDYSVWPFTSRRDYKLALRAPRRLAGHGAK